MSDEQKIKISNTLKGRKRPEAARMNISKALKGRKCPSVSERMKKLVREKNPSWKGDDVGNSGLHKHIRKYLPKPQTCHLCNKVPPIDVACITGIYNREFKNWAWFCKKCHVNYDNIIPRLILNRVYKNKIGRKKND